MNFLNESLEVMKKFRKHQEVEEVFPQFVYHDQNSDSKLVFYANLTSVLVQAVKELKAENEALEARIYALEAALVNQKLEQ